jgi:MtrB/PioB family decaheme-associated outer membrane protein
MKTNFNRFSVRISVIAVHGAIMSMVMLPAAAYAAETDPTVADLTTPTNTIEVGATYTKPSNSDNRSNVINNSNGNNTSYKFGEYNGRQERGLTGDLNFDVRGGGYNDSENATRFRITGTDLGLETRSLSGEYGKQGSFRINIGYDELRRNRSDTFMSPYGYGGATGGAYNFTLPSSWVKPIEPQANATNTSTGQNFRALDPVNGVANTTVFGVGIAPTAGTLTTLANNRATDLAAYQNVNLHTKRERMDGGLIFNINALLDIKASFKHEEKTGFKPLSVVSSQNTEYGVTLADPINQTTDQYNLSLNFKSDKGFMSAEYYGSLFKNDIKSVTWNDVGNLASTATYASAPSNQFHQFGLTGGYYFTPTTKLVMNGSYARNTQNDSYVTAGQNGQFPLGLPTSSLNGLVVTKAFGLKLTAKPIKDLGLTAQYKYDNRDNRTDVKTYYFHDANEAAGSGSFAFGSLGGLTVAQLGGNLNAYANRAYSKKSNQLNLDADYAVAKNQAVKVGYDYAKIDRSCDSWYNCADAPTTKENTLRAEWRGRLVEDLTGKVGYAYSKRTVNYDENAFLAFLPYANVIPTTGTGAGATMSSYQWMVSKGLTGFGVLAGYGATAAGNDTIFGANNNVVPNALYGSRNVVSELIGMRRFNMADRNRDKWRTSLNWQATDKFSLQAGFDYDDDDYKNSVYGLTSSKAGTLNLDGTYAASEDFSATVFYTYEDKRSKSAGDAFGSNNNGTGNNATVSVNSIATGATTVSGGCYATVALKNQNAKIDPCLQWSTDMRDKVDTLGVTLTQKRLMSGKLDLKGDLVFSRARTDIGVTGGSYVQNPALVAAGGQTTAVAFYYIPASALPTVTTNIIELKLNGKYQIDKTSAVRLGYTYTHLKAVDWAYDGMQFGTGTNYLPTNEQAPNFTVHTIGAAYLYSFK